MNLFGSMTNDKMKTMANKKNYTVEKHPTTNILHMTVLGFINFEDIKAMWNEALPLMDNERQKILYDATLGRAQPAEARQWAIDVLGKQLSEKRVKMARVVSQDIFNNLIAEQIKDKITKDIPNAEENIQLFENAQDAEEWLLRE